MGRRNTPALWKDAKKLGNFHEMGARETETRKLNQLEQLAASWGTTRTYLL